MMVGAWVYLRLWYFPVNVIWRIVEETRTWPDHLFNWHFVTFHVSFLVALVLMHVFWLYIMIKGVLRRCKSRN